MSTANFSRPSDAGPEDNGAPIVFDECQNCSAPSESLTYLAGWDYLSCPACALEAAAADRAELAVTMTAAGLTPEEMRAYRAMVERRVA